MTIVVATRDRIVSDSRLDSEGTYYSVGKIFRMPDGGLLATCGDSRLTHAFESAMLRGVEPEPIDSDEEFDGVVLKPTGELVLYAGANFAPFPVGDPHVVLGNWMALGAARSWLMHDATPEVAVRRAIEVDPACGGEIITVLLHPPAVPRPKVKSRGSK